MSAKLININAPTVGLTASTTGANVALPALGYSVTVTNLGSNPAWCTTGIGSGTAATATTGNGCCVAPGTVQSFEMDFGHNYLAAESTTGNTLLSISVGQGGA